MQTAKIALAEELGPASQLVALIEGGKFVEALELNAEIAGEMPFARLVERWFVEKIEAVWPDGAAAKAWADARAPGKERLKNLGARLEAAKRKIDEARAKGPVAPAVITKPAPSSILKDFEKLSEAPKPPPGASALERLTYPPGLLGHAVEHAFHCTDYPDRRIAFWGAMTGMAKILDRRVIGPTGSSTVNYGVLIAASGAGKEDAQQFALLLLRAVGCEKLFQGGSLASVQAVEDLVRVTPNCLVIIDEFGRWFKMIQDQSGNVSELPGVLCKLWGQKPHGRYGLMRRANRTGKDDETVEVQWPTFALAGASVSEPFWNACGDEHISGGFLNRCWIIDAGLGGTEFVAATRNPEKLHDWLVKAMRDITGGISPMQGSRPIMDNGLLGPCRLKWGAKAEEAYRDHVSTIRKLPEGRKRDLSIRTPEIAVRLATSLARWCGMLEVGSDHYEWGWSWAEHSRDMVLAGANENMKVKRDFAEICRHIKHLLADGPMRWMDIRSKSRSAAGQFGMEIVEKAMQELLDCREVREISHAEQLVRSLRGPRGAPGRWFELAGVGN